MSFRPPSPGVIVDSKYRLAERIGGGGMGDVFRAETLLTPRSVVAIKFLHPELAQNVEVGQRFFQEAQAVNRIRHANVVEVSDAGVSELGPYIVMEYLDGESVGAALSRVNRFEVDATVGTLIPVLEALDAAHRVGIIHRDLKPENVFIARDGTRGGVVVRLLDFGIAKVLDGGSPGPRTRTGVVFGTPDYLSPEQATGEGPLDGRSDLFSVGVLMYELVTGMRPFRAPTAVATAFKVVHAEAPSIASSGVHADQRLEAVVHRLLHKDPARRYQTAPDVIRDLEKLCPDPARRLVALAKIVGASRRLGQAQQPGPETDRLSQARDAGVTRRITPDISHLVTQVSRVSTGSDVAPSGPRSRGLFPDDPGGAKMREPISSRPPDVRVTETPKSPRPSEPDLSRAARGATGAGGAEGRAVPPPPDPTLRSVRAFPLRFAGKYHVRGPVLRSVDKGIVDMFGAEARDELVAQLPERFAAEFRGAINALVGYDLEAVDAYMEHASAFLVREPMRWREIGRLSVDGELHSVVRTLLRPAVDLGPVIRRGVTTWARLFSFGAWRVGLTANGKVSLTISEFDPVPHQLRLWVVGVIEQIARRAVRADARVFIIAGDQDFSPELVCEIF
jgi:serine/threonine protein kinase